ncbi:HDOD domain-containing protein [Cognatazoarcus halotolerans]|uniref:HDOD domain-containing protein n=1 Tax=Cognatazoarcus halotolerans TaxID=2686016 RepID=UPI0013598B24|nr:HDOD domain-containing protein [Cognatazoarcus halotolerans]MCB1902052.1 HDOD domain-containing protein [Rhodocyclaceae bacterium]MCP5309512.1 HDOD domain-containing protein [Zoogloeaceae bacterium]
MHSAQEMIYCLDRLLSLPEVFHRIEREIDTPESSLEEVARLISNDPALSIRLLHVANSAMFGFPSRITTVTRAVQLLGLRQVRDLSLAILVTSTFGDPCAKGFDARAYWRASVLRAVASTDLARKSGMSEPERLFLLGLLADLGHMVMYLTIADEARAAQDYAITHRQPLHLVERQTIGCDYGEVGAALLSQWRLPDSFARAVASQFEPRLAGSGAQEASIIYLANQIARADRDGLTSTEIIEECPPFIWDLSAVEPDELPAVRASAELGLAAALAVFFPR